MNLLLKNKKNILYILILIAYSAIVITTGFHHEPWADEAQSFLFARDCSIHELIFNELKYEGHPIVWYLFLKIILFTNFISSQTLYENIFIIPAIMSILGIYLLLFKTKLPIFFKILIPFGFFFCYQYPIIARNHSLVFPILTIIGVLYKNRLQRPYLYSFLLIILSNISAYSFIIAGILFLFFSFDVYIKNRNVQLKKYIPNLIIAIVLLLTIIYMNRPEDCSSVAKLDFSKLNLYNFFTSLHSCYFNFVNNPIFYIESIIIAAFYFLSAKIFCRNKYQLCLFLAINLPLIIFLTVLYSNDWHYGYIIVFYTFTLQILSDENNISTLNFKENTLFYIVSFIILSTQILWSYISYLYDIKYTYCPSKKIAEYIKTKDYNNMTITAISIKPVAIQPYFEENLYANFSGKSHYTWKMSAAEAQFNFPLLKSDMIIIPSVTYKTYQNSLKILEDKYLAKIFSGAMISRGKLKETNDFIIFEKINK